MPRKWFYYLKVYCNFILGLHDILLMTHTSMKIFFTDCVNSTGITGIELLRSPGYMYRNARFAVELFRCNEN